MPIGSLANYISGFTSDHTYQSATFTSYAADGTEVTLVGMTWNLLNRCRAADQNRPSNNPFDLQETDEAYEARKKAQLKFLWGFIKKNELDFICLQEVDVFLSSPHPKYVAVFFAALKKRGWAMVHPKAGDNLRRPLITLYNSKRIHLLSQAGVFPTQRTGKHTGLEGIFNYGKYKVCITNIHLDYETDHRDEILQYQMKKIEEDIFTIIGGDANHQPGKEHFGMVGDMNMATNIYAETDSEVKEYVGE